MRAVPEANCNITRARRRTLPVLLLALAVTTPSLACFYTLPQLLQMPLERLLELRIGAR